MAGTMATLDDLSGRNALTRFLSSLPSSSTAHIRLRHHAQRCSPAMTAVIRSSGRFSRKDAGPPSLFPQPAPHHG